MKIGILTFHREENFGAVFQAYALMNFLKQKGHDAKMVDYDPPYRSDNRKLISPVLFQNANIMNKVKMLISAAKNFKKKKGLHRLFLAFQQKYFEVFNKTVITDIEYATEYYDVVIVGSDQIWQPFVANRGNFDIAYFNGYPKGRKHLSYAGSIGNIGMLSEDKTNIFFELLNGLDNISVREEDLFNLIKSRGYSPNLVCDPVFLLPKKVWQEFANTHVVNNLPDRFIFLHRATDHELNEMLLKDILEYENMPIVVLDKKRISFRQQVVKIDKIEQIIYILSKASFVITSSFHCTAFSLIFDRKFLTYNKNPERARTITKKLGVPNRCIDTYSPDIVQNILNEDVTIDYDNNNFINRSRIELLKSLEI